MVGSYLTNCFAALIAFTIYFLMSLQSLKSPSTIIIWSFIVAIIVFLITYLIRYLIAFVMYTSSDEEAIDEGEKATQNHKKDADKSLKENKDEILTENQAKELAEAVKTMMSNDE
ncbi:hypothetical protein ACWV26_04760 [Rummeliibacillus sp. JY-2-4R]